MKKPYLLLASILAILSITFVPVALAQKPKKPLLSDLSGALGFIMGQRVTINRIKSEYPTLAYRALKAELSFQTNFGTAEKNIKKVLKNLLKDKYQGYILRMKTQIISILKKQIISQKISEQYLITVESRALGEIPSPILQTLLNYQFQEKPAHEFAQGFRTIYRTKGHLKSKGLDFQVEYAKSWSKREARRPNVIQFFSSNNGKGPAVVAIATIDLSKKMRGSLTPEIVKALSTLEGCKLMASEMLSKRHLKAKVYSRGMTNVRDFKSKRIMIDHWPGAMLEFMGEVQQLDFKLTMYSRRYIALYKNYAFYLECFVVKSPSETPIAFENTISLYKPLFHQMANSLVIQSQY